MSARLSLASDRRLRVGGLLACCFLLFPTGCGPDYKARGVVKGTVTSGKKPLTVGTVMFYGKTGNTGSASIQPDGTYIMPDAPVGECKVTVTVPEMDPSSRARLKGKGPAMPSGPMNPEEAGGPPAPPLAVIPKEVVPIDAKYSNPETSGLTFTVQKGEQTYNIDL